MDSNKLNHAQDIALSVFLNNDLQSAETQIHTLCHADATLTQEVRQCLRLLENEAEGLSDPLINEILGDWKVVAFIGEGAHGKVYRVIRQSFYQEGAMKVLSFKALDPQQEKHLHLRFQLERELLIKCNTPGVARVFDGGVAPKESCIKDQPYLVTEFAGGVSITEYCNMRRLPLVDRLDLFSTLCAVVGVVHRKSIVHRDIKPSNVLVGSKLDSMGVVKAELKLIDFGVAKVIGQVFTSLEANDKVIGTPYYMSPEQAGYQNLEVDACSDVYSLGVVLHEMLIGTPPFIDCATVRPTADEVMRKKCEGPATLMSHQLRGISKSDSPALKEHLKMVQFERATSVQKLIKSLRGDLDCIVARCLERDPGMRYAHPSDIAADIQRHFEGKVITARRPTIRHRLAKYFERHRIGTAVGIFLAVALGWVAVQHLKLNRQLKATNEELNDVVKYQAKMLGDLDLFKLGSAITESVKSQIASGLERTWIAGDHEIPRQRTNAEIALAMSDANKYLPLISQADLAKHIVKIAILQPAITAIDQYKKQPVVQEKLLNTVAQISFDVGMYDDALMHWQKVRRIREEHYGSMSAEVADVLGNLGIAQMALGQLDSAEKQCREALAMARNVLPEASKDVATNLSNLGVILTRKGTQRDLDEAEQLLESALRIFTSLSGEKHEDTAMCGNNLSLVDLTRKHLGKARKRLERVLEIQEEILPRDAKAIGITVCNLAETLRQDDQLEKAQPLYKRALNILRDRLGESHPDVITVTSNYALLLINLGDLDGAAQLLDLAITARKRILGPRHYYVALSLDERGALAHVMGDETLAATLMQEGLEIRIEQFGPDSLEASISLNNLGQLYVETGDLNKAPQYLMRALSIRRSLLNPINEDLANTINGVAELLRLQQVRKPDPTELKRAEHLFREALDIRLELFGRRSVEVGISLSNFGLILCDCQKHDEAIDNLKRALSIHRELLPPMHLTTMQTLSSLSEVLTKLKKYKEAEAYAIEAAESAVANDRAALSKRINVVSQTIQLYVQWNKAEPSDALIEKAESWRVVKESLSTKVLTSE